MTAAALDARVSVGRAHFVLDVSLRVAPGETVAVMGPSGAGKSTLLGALAGLVPLAAGEIVVDDRVVERAWRAPASRWTRAFASHGRGEAGQIRSPAHSPRLGRVHVPPMARGVVLLGQDAALFPHLSARENVAFGPRAAGTPRAMARADADAWLERVGLPRAGGRRPSELSGGEQQRVAVARALAASPRVVLLDEPLVALDPETASAIREMLRRQLSGVTTVAVTHDAVDAVALARRLVVIEAGRVTQHGGVRDVLAAPASRFVASIAGVNRVVGTSTAGGWERRGVRIEADDPLSRSLAARGEGAALAAVFRPADVAVLARPVRRPNAWESAVTRLEPTPAGVRVQTQWCAVDLPVGESARFSVGDRIALAIDPGAVRFVPAT